jgi:branched-chain amino acid transport system substrate-binding protein
VLTSMESERQARWVSNNPQTLGRVFQVGSVWSHYGSHFFRTLSEFEKSGVWCPPNRDVVFVETRVSGGQVFDQRASRTASQLGWVMHDILEVSAFDADWREALAVVQECRPAAVLVTHFVPRELANFQQLFVQEPRDTLVHCVYAPSLPEYYDRAGPAAEGVIWSTVNGTYSDNFGKAFLRKYEKRFGRESGRSVAGTAYDQVNLIVNAWARAGNARSFGLVAEELRRNVIRGVSGVYWLGNPGQTGLCYPEDTLDPSMSLAALVFQVQDGQNRIISPSPYTEAALQLPPWFASEVEGSRSRLGVSCSDVGPTFARSSLRRIPASSDFASDSSRAKGSSLTRST